MESKFWKAGSSSSSESDSSSEAGEPIARVEGKRGWEVESSSEDEGRRVVRSGHDKRFDELRQHTMAMRNHMRNKDYAAMLTDLELLMKTYQKTKQLAGGSLGGGDVGRDGAGGAAVPGCLVKVLCDVEGWVEDLRLNARDEIKKLSKAKATAYNTLRSRIRKTNDNPELRPLIDECIQNPDAFDEAAADDSDMDDDDEKSSSDDESISESSSSDSDDSSGSDSDSSSDSSSDSGDESDGSSMSSSSSGSSASSVSSGRIPPNVSDAKAAALRRWGVSTSKSKKEKTAAEKENKAQKVKKSKAKDAADGVPRQKKIKETLAEANERTAEALRALENIDKVETLKQKCVDVAMQRCRKGQDNQLSISLFLYLREVSKKFGKIHEAETLIWLISAELESSGGSFSFLPSKLWTQTSKHIEELLDIFEHHTDILIELGKSPEESKEDAENQPPTKSSKKSGGMSAAVSPVIPESALPQPSTGAEDGENPTGTRGGPNATAAPETPSIVNRAISVITHALQRLDDELTKSLQLGEVHSNEYHERLAQTSDVLLLLIRGFLLAQSQLKSGNTSTEDPVRLASRVGEHLHYKHRCVLDKQLELLRKKAETSSSDLLKSFMAPSSPDGGDPEKMIQYIVQFLYDHGDHASRVQALLFEAMQHALHDRYIAARDLLKLTNAQELALSTGNISTQILFNRTLVQTGLAAFRQGETEQAYQALSDVCAQGKLKELLAQGVSTQVVDQKTAERQRAERRRQLPYHMHISSDLVDGVHQTCAMLIDIPTMASASYDRSASRRIVSKHFRKILDIYDRHLFVGPPETMRDVVLAAAKALQKGDWETCWGYIKSHRLWQGLPNPAPEEKEKVQSVILQRIKEEAMRTYILTYGTYYAAMSVQQLSKMFELDSKNIQKVVNKMIVSGETPATWDEGSTCIMLYLSAPSKLQSLSLQLSDKLALMVEFNERLRDGKEGNRVLGPPGRGGGWAGFDRDREYDGAGKRGPALRPEGRWVDKGSKQQGPLATRPYGNRAGRGRPGAAGLTRVQAAAVRDV